MEQNNIEIFINQIPDALVNFPNLQVCHEETGEPYLKGILDIPNDLGEVVTSFLVEIRCSPGFPYRFPQLFEIGGEIPLEADWHRYADGRCCITVLPEEIVICKLGINISRFIKEHAIAYLANYIHRKEIGEYKNGEFSHGTKGHFEYYSKLLKTNEKDLWHRYYEDTFSDRPEKYDRNSRCFCGSEKKYKRCHMEVFDVLRDIGKQQVLYDFSMILK